jgi:1,4-dihydroxy-2-naphthoate octaprenyltransferase
MSTERVLQGGPSGPPPFATWVAATRPQFLTAIGLPVLVGTSVAWWSEATFSLGLLLLTLLAALLGHAGANVINDYFDHRSGADDLNEDPLTPFAGGSRMIQLGRLSPRQTLWLGLALLGAAIALGIGLVLISGMGLLWIGLLGMALAWYYSAPPLALNYRGLGEVVVALDFGVLTIAGASYVQLGTVPLAAWYVSVIVGLLVAAILYINEFPDHDADRAAGKRTLVVLLGPERAVALLPLFTLLPLGLIGTGVLLGLMPWPTLVALAAAPLAVRAQRVLRANYREPRALVPAIQSVIGLQAAVCLILALAYPFG